MSDCRVLLTCAGGLQGLTLIKELRALHGISIHVVNNQEESIGRYFADNYSVAPPVAAGKSYQEFLRGYVRQNSINYLVPTTPHDLELLAKLKSDFKKEYGCSIAVSEPALLTLLLNKTQCMMWLKEHDFSTQELIALDQLKYHFPIFGRKNQGWGGKGSIVITDSHALLKLQDIESYAWTAFIEEFSEYSVDFCIGFEGSVSKLVARQRRATLTGYAVVMEDQCLPDAVVEALNKLSETIANHGGCGIFNIQLIEDTSGRFFFSDINPRIGTSAVLAAHTGRNLCAHLLKKRAPVSTSSSSTGMKIVRYMEEVVISPCDLRNVKGIVFDLDDTLIAHRSWILAKVAAVASQFLGDGQNEFLAAAAHFIDEGKAFCLYDCLCETFGLEHLKMKMIEAHREFMPTSSYAYPEVASVLSKLSGQYELGLLSDNPVVSQRQKLNALPQTNLFKSIVLTGHSGQSKPAVQPFHSIAELMQIPPSEIVMVGDNYHRDVMGALNAGFVHAFFVRRPDRMFNTQPWVLNPERVTTISGLRELSWYM